MTINRTAMIVIAGLFCAPGLALAEDAISAPAKKTIGSAKTQIVPSLIVINSHGASLQGTTLALTGVLPNSIMFADRPVRSAGHALTAHLLEEWAPGKGSFASDPPNATVSVLSADASSVADAVVVLKDPKLVGDTLTFNVEVLEGSLAGAGDGPASIFIDNVGLPSSPQMYFSARSSAWYSGHPCTTTQEGRGGYDPSQMFQQC